MTFQEVRIEGRHEFLRGTRHVRPFTIKDDNDSPLCRCGDLLHMCVHRIGQGGQCPAPILVSRYDALIAVYRAARRVGR
jgi:hypothetical protein